MDRYPLLLRPLLYLWASPASIVGLVVGCVGLATGGGIQIRGGVIEFYGGATRWFLSHLWIRARAMTLGHTILGCSRSDLDYTRNHEHVHVRQFNRWGPLMIPAYLLCSVVLWLRGRNPYLDNPFEVEAYDQFP